jgi:hypothetical protein
VHPNTATLMVSVNPVGPALIPPAPI